MVEGHQQIVSEAHQDGVNLFTPGLAHKSTWRRPWQPPASRGGATLADAIEADIIPRLLMARSQPKRAPRPDDEAQTADGIDVDAFADMLLGSDPDNATAYAFGLFARGVSAEHLFLALLAPAARHLGDRWLADHCTFAHVTLGTWRLHKLLRDLTPAFQQSAGRVDVNRNILLVNLPGEQHTFGLSMLVEFFRRARWNVACSNPLPNGGDAVDMVGTEWFNVVGFSLSSEHRLDELARLIRTVRRNSCNRAVKIMVGGAAFAEHPEFVARVDADLSAVDGSEAPSQAEALVDWTASMAC